ncbi:MAG: rhodanese-like domain-containing protein [Candidatus Hodarchaeota archaeon]
MKTNTILPKYTFLATLILIVSLLSFNGYYSANGMILKRSYNTISVLEAKKLIENSTDLFILDVRTETEYKGGHIEGAYLLPHSDIIDRQDELPENKSQPILIYCRSGTRSATASNTLESLNFTQIYNMEGGFDAWKNAGYPYINSSTTGSSLILGVNFLVLVIIYFKKRH